MSKPRAVECVKSSGHVLSLTSCELIILLPCSVSSGNLVLVPDPCTWEEIWTNSNLPIRFMSPKYRIFMYASSPDPLCVRGSGTETSGDHTPVGLVQTHFKKTLRKI